MDEIERLGASIYQARIAASHGAWLARMRVSRGTFTLDDVNALARDRTGRFRL